MKKFDKKVKEIKENLETIQYWEDIIKIRMWLETINYVGCIKTNPESFKVESTYTRSEVVEVVKKKLTKDMKKCKNIQDLQNLKNKYKLITVYDEEINRKVNCYYVPYIYSVEKISEGIIYYYWCDEDGSEEPFFSSNL